jgi:hypothetical protein
MDDTEDGNGVMASQGFVTEAGKPRDPFAAVCVLSLPLDLLPVIAIGALRPFADAGFYSHPVPAQCHSQ